MSTENQQQTRFPVSIVILTKNEEDHIRQCLNSCAWADDVVVVDSGSRDRTLDIARKAGAYVIHQGWLGFGPQRRFAVSQASHDWVLCLDADERVSPELAASIREAVTRSMNDANAPHVYSVPRKSFFLGRYLKHGNGYPDRQVRLFHRGYAEWDDAPVEERLETKEDAVRLKGDLIHTPSKNVGEYIEKQIRFAYMRAAYMHEHGARAKPWKIIFSPFGRFFRDYVLHAGFLDGLPGFIHCCCGSISAFVKYARLSEIQVAEKKKAAGKK